MATQCPQSPPGPRVALLSHGSGWTSRGTLAGDVPEVHAAEMTDFLETFKFPSRTIRVDTYIDVSYNETMIAGASFVILPGRKAAVVVASQDSMSPLLDFLGDLRRTDRVELDAWIAGFQAMASSGWPGDSMVGVEDLRCYRLLNSFAVTFEDPPRIVICGYGWGTKPSEQLMCEARKVMSEYNQRMKKSNRKASYECVPRVDTRSE